MREELPVEKKFDHRDFEFLNDEEKFTKIYENNFWGNSESISGNGSTLLSTRVIREMLPDVLRQLGVTSMLDAPCGDFNWMSYVDLYGINYTGMDIVTALINSNKITFPSVNFIVGDLATSDLPKVDLILCRDCLVHLDYKTIDAVLENIRKSSIKYLMTTHFTECDANRDIVTGNWRPLNFELPPFNFKQPLFIINEQCEEGNGTFKDKSLALWAL